MKTKLKVARAIQSEPSEGLCFSAAVLPLLLVDRNVVLDSIVLHVIAGRPNWRSASHGHGGHLLMQLTKLIVWWWVLLLLLLWGHVALRVDDGRRSVRSIKIWSWLVSLWWRCLLMLRRHVSVRSRWLLRLLDLCDCGRNLGVL